MHSKHLKKLLFNESRLNVIILFNFLSWNLVSILSSSPVPVTIVYLTLPKLLNFIVTQFRC